MPALSLVTPLMLWGGGVGTEASRLLTPCPQLIRRETGPQAPGCQIPKPSTGQAASCQGQSPTDCGLNEERRGSRGTYASPITWGQVSPRLSLQGSSESPLWGWKGIPCPISYMFNAPPTHKLSPWSRLFLDSSSSHRKQGFASCQSFKVYPA